MIVRSVVYCRQKIGLTFDSVRTEYELNENYTVWYNSYIPCWRTFAFHSVQKKKQICYFLPFHFDLERLCEVANVKYLLFYWEFSK